MTREQPQPNTKPAALFIEKQKTLKKLLIYPVLFIVIGAFLSFLTNLETGVILFICSIGFIFYAYIDYERWLFLFRQTPSLRLEEQGLFIEGYGTIPFDHIQAVHHTPDLLRIDLEGKNLAAYPPAKQIGAQSKSLFQKDAAFFYEFYFPVTMSNMPVKTFYQDLMKATE